MSAWLVRCVWGWMCRWSIWFILERYYKFLVSNARLGHDGEVPRGSERQVMMDAVVERLEELGYELREEEWGNAF